MVIGERLKALREHRNMSQGDIEKRTGLLRIYVFRVENGHTVPAIETPKNSLGRSKSRSTNFSMTVRIRRRLLSVKSSYSRDIELSVEGPNDVPDTLQWSTPGPSGEPVGCCTPTRISKVVQFSTSVMGAARSSQNWC